MCYAIPGKIVELQGKIAIIDYFGEKRKAINDFIEARIGEYVYAQGGLVVAKVPKKKAEEILNFWKNRFFELKSLDKRMSEVKVKGSPKFLYLIEKTTKSELTKKEMIEIIKTNRENDLKLLFETANNIRQRFHGNSCCVHGIIEFSNYCENNCFYCGIRKDSKIKRYRMSIKEIVETAKEAVKKYGFKSLVLQSGEDFWYTEEKLLRIVKETSKLGILLFLSIGERSEKTYEKLYNAGARGVLLRFETSNEKIFKKLRPGKSLKKRISLIKNLRNMGYIIATGFLIGLPGESEKDIVNNILLTKKLKPEMYSFGPMIPAKNTPLENHKQVDKNLVLKTIALSRLIDKKAKILVTTALETLDKNAKKQGLLSGANSLMINVTPLKYRRLYGIYPNRAGSDKEIDENIKETVDLLYSLGRAPTDLGL
ncbi:MAG: [FeFe] hydrogenase H-cluster radical SAM maturase HydE [Candidatus Aenigmatarchaeota archaeon]